MEEIKVVVADDYEASRKLLRRMLESIPYLTFAGEAANGEELIQQVLTEEPHLVLVDISMPKLNGIEAVRECLKILPELKVIFITGHDQYALEAYNLAAVDYVVKPLERTRLYQAIEKARQLIKRREDEVWKEVLKVKGKIEKLVVRWERSIYFIPKQDILFIEKTGRKSLIHTAKKSYESNETLGALLKRLNAAFFQAHRSYIVNLEHLESIKPSGETYLVHFQDFERPAYISKNKINEILSLLDESPSSDSGDDL